MGEDEKAGLRERVSHWLDAFEIIQEAAQQRGLSVQEAKELAKTILAALVPYETRAWSTPPGDSRLPAEEIVKAVKAKQERHDDMLRKHQEVDQQRGVYQTKDNTLPATIVWTVQPGPPISGNSCASSGVSIAPYPYPQGKED